MAFLAQKLINTVNIWFNFVLGSFFKQDHLLRPFSIQLKNPSTQKNSAKIYVSACAVKHDCAISEIRAEKVGGRKSWKLSTFLADFLSWNFNSQSDFVLISTTFFNMASTNEAAREIYQGFSDDAIRNFLFQWLQQEESCIEQY